MFGLGLGLGFDVQESGVDGAGGVPILDDLLQEDGTEILQEDGSFILLE